MLSYRQSPNPRQVTATSSNFRQVFMNTKQEVMDDENDINAEQTHFSWNGPGAIRGKPTEEKDFILQDINIKKEPEDDNFEGQTCQVIDAAKFSSTEGDQQQYLHVYERNLEIENRENDQFYLQVRMANQVSTEKDGPNENNMQDTTQSSTAEDSELNQEKRHERSQSKRAILKEQRLLDERPGAVQGDIERPSLRCTLVRQTTPNRLNESGTSPTNLNRERNGSRTCIGEDIYNWSIRDNVLTDSSSSKTNMVNQSENKSFPMTCVKEENPHHSPKCDEMFPIVTNLPSRKGTNGVESLECTFCSLEFSSGPDLATHMIIHTEEKSHHCPYCDKSFTLGSTLNVHLRTHSGERPYQCSVCEKRFSHCSSLSTHMKTHSGEKPYQCLHCGKRFALKNSLNMHLRTHTGEKPYQCSVCNKRFSQCSSLSTHMRIHTGEKPYQCPQCDKRFALKNSLNMHLRTHTGEKPYQCSVCTKRFSQSSSLSSHKKIHTGEKPFQCPLCYKRFAHKYAINMHFTTLHTLENS